MEGVSPAGSVELPFTDFAPKTIHEAQTSYERYRDRRGDSFLFFYIAILYRGVAIILFEFLNKIIFIYISILFYYFIKG